MWIIILFEVTTSQSGLYKPKARKRAMHPSCWSRRRLIADRNRTPGNQRSLPACVLRPSLQCLDLYMSVDRACEQTVTTPSENTCRKQSPYDATVTHRKATPVDNTVNTPACNGQTACYPSSYFYAIFSNHIRIGYDTIWYMLRASHPTPLPFLRACSMLVHSALALYTAR